MKYIYLLLLLPFHLCLFAQPDSLSAPLSATEQNQMFDLLHRRSENLPLVLKWNAGALIPTGSGSTPSKRIFYISPQLSTPACSWLTMEADLEAKVTAHWTLDAGFELVSGAASPEVLYEDTPERSTWSRFRLEARYYLANIAGTAPAGTYIAGQYASTAVFGNDIWDFASNYFTEKTRFCLRVGAQWRLFNSGYFDFSYGIGYARGLGPEFTISPSSEVERRVNHVFFIEPHLGIGLALTAPNKNRDADREKWRALFRRYRERVMWRIDLLQAVQWPNEGQLSLQIPIAYERKIAQSAWSVGLESKGRYFIKSQYIQPFWSDEYPARQWEFELAADVRHYAFQRQIRLKGKSGDHLCGPYWGIRIAWNRNVADGQIALGDVVVPEGRTIQHEKWIAALAGFQFRVHRLLFLGYQAGFGPRWILSRRYYSLPVKLPDIETRQHECHWFSRLSIGLAF